MILEVVLPVAIAVLIAGIILTVHTVRTRVKGVFDWQKECPEMKEHSHVRITRYPPTSRLPADRQAPPRYSTDAAPSSLRSPDEQRNVEYWGGDSPYAQRPRYSPPESPR